MIERAKNKEILNKEATTVKSTVKPEAEDLRYIRGYKDVVESEYWIEVASGQRVYSPSLGKWEGLISIMDSALSSLSTEKELTIIEQYLSFTLQNPSLISNSDQTEKAISICRQRLATVSEKWASLRRGHIERIINLEADVTSLRDQIKELEKDIITVFQGLPF